MATYNGHNEDSSGNILLSIGNGMTATVETGTTASQAYTKGSYLFFNNRLCKATSAISSGATLAIGTNLSQTSIGQEITSHLRSSDGKEFYFDVKDGTYGYYPSASKTASEFVPFGGTKLSGVKGYINNNSYQGVTVGLENFAAPITFSNYSANWTLDYTNGKATIYGDGLTTNITITDAKGHSITGGCSAYYGKRILSTSPAVIVGVGAVGTGNTAYTHGGSVDSNYSVSYSGTYDNGGQARLCTVEFF